MRLVTKIWWNVKERSCSQCFTFFSPSFTERRHLPLHTVIQSTPDPGDHFRVAAAAVLVKKLKPKKKVSADDIANQIRLPKAYKMYQSNYNTTICMLWTVPGRELNSVGYKRGFINGRGSTIDHLFVRSPRLCWGKWNDEISGNGATPIPDSCKMQWQFNRHNNRFCGRSEVKLGFFLIRCPISIFNSIQFQFQAPLCFPAVKRGLSQG